MPRRPIRHTLILAGAALGTALAAMGGWRYARASAPLNGPLVVISIDTLRADHLSAYGGDQSKTPAIDQLAADGVVFERAYSQVPLTLPAHVALLSGRLPFDTGVRDDVGFALKSGERLLPQMLRERGYTTAAVMSSYLLRKETGINQGFDFFDADVPVGRPGQSTSDLRRDGSESEQIAERWLDSVGTARAFLFLHLAEPHQPYTPSPFSALYAPYDAAVAREDAIVGHFVHYLKSHQLYDRSTIVLLSDHGEGLGDHFDPEHGVFLYDEAIHIPLIIKQEGNLGAGHRVDDPVQQVDLVPTILELVKAPVPGSLRGTSLRPLLDGTAHLPERAIYSESLHAKYEFGWSDLTAITEGHYRYIKAPHEELYDLARDPLESENLADKQIDTRRRLRGKLDMLTAGVASPATGNDAAADPKDQRETLAMYRLALGLARERRWPQAIVALQHILHDDPTLVNVWNQLAIFASAIDRFDIVANAYAHVAELRPADPEPRLERAGALLTMKRLDEARAQAELAAEVALDDDAGNRRAAHELLVRIALARHDADRAHLEAVLVQQIDQTSPMVTYVEARGLYEAGRYQDAFPLFERAIAGLKKSTGLPIPELYFYAADTATRLGRYPLAEAEFLEELRHFPQNTRARAALAALYQAMDRPDDAAHVVADMIRLTPTAESYAAATRLWKALGNIDQAEAVRAEGRRSLAEQTSTKLGIRN